MRSIHVLAAMMSCATTGFGCGTASNHGDDGAYYTAAITVRDIAFWADYEDAVLWYSTDPLDPFYFLRQGAQPVQTADRAPQAAQTVAQAAPNYFHPTSC